LKLSDRNIIIVSNEPWGPVWFSKHHYANELSKHNRVYFIDPPSRWTGWSSLSNEVEEERINPNLSVLRYRNFLPLNGTGGFFHKKNARKVYKLLNQYFAAHEISGILFLSFDPFRLQDPGQLEAVDFSVYYRADYYTNAGEKQLCQNVDLLLVIAKEMISTYEHYDKPIYFIPHGVPDETSSLAPPEKERNEMLMVGTLGPRIDFELLNKAAEEFPEIKLKLLGPFSGLDFMQPPDKKYLKKLERRENVTFAGARTFPEMCGEIQQARVCLVGYKQSSLNNQQNSLKILQYLSFGKPVVSGTFEELKQAESEGLLWMADSHEDFLKNLKTALSENGADKLRERRIDFASNFKYSKLIKDIERIITVVEEKNF